MQRSALFDRHPLAAVSASATAIGLTPTHAHPLRRSGSARLRSAMIAAAGVLIVLAVAASGYLWLRERVTTTPPFVQPVDVYRTVIDTTAVTVTIAAGGEYVELSTTADQLRTDVTIWRRMHLANWNEVPGTVRNQVLARMTSHYRDILMNPAQWDAMGPADWDLVPQPMQTIAYRQMIAYWTGYYRLAELYALPPRLVADTLSAIVMSESWFDHRAVGINRDGSRDIGLAGASEFARERVRQLYRNGIVDVGLDDAAYFNPWTAARFVAMWMSLLLDETQGDLERSVRAYNRGAAAAGDRLGTVYYEAVQRRLHRFIRNGDAPHAWDYIWRIGRVLEQQQWPWMRPTRPLPHRTVPLANSLTRAPVILRRR